MSSSAVMVYDVTLNQLSPDARKAGLEFSATTRAGLTRKELRALLKAAADTATTVGYPLTPELRVVAPTGNYVIQMKEGRLNFVSWASLNSRGGIPTPDQMLEIITGEIVEGDTGLPEIEAPVRGEGGSKNWKRAALAVLLVAVVVGVNAITFLQAKKPPGNFLPSYTLLEAGPAERVFAGVAGNYETGGQPGDRRLQIASNGAVQWLKFGADRAVAERREFTTQAVEVAGAPALLTSRQSVIKIKDPTTVTLFGDTYVRVGK